MLNLPNKKIAVVLANLGGPEKSEDIAEFRKAFFTGVISLGLRNPLHKIGIGNATLPLPEFLQKTLAPFIADKIANRKITEATGGYHELHHIWQERDFTSENLQHLENSFNKGGSPIHASTRQQIEDIAAQLNKDHHGQAEFSPYVAMTYWPQESNKNAINDIKQKGFDEVVWISAYPQYSVTTTGDAKKVWEKAAKENSLNAPTKFIESYAASEGFIQAHIDRLKTAYDKLVETGAAKDDIKIVFSAHGLPQRFIDDGDPYVKQVEETVNAICKKLSLKTDQILTSYQSKATNEPWTEPNTEDVVKKLGANKQAALIVPVAFIGDHIETTVELGEEYKEVYQNAGGNGKHYQVVTAIENHPSFVKDIAAQVSKLFRLEKTKVEENSTKVELIAQSQQPNNILTLDKPIKNIASNEADIAKTHGGISL